MVDRGIVLVTGAGSGIGHASAIRLARDGWRIAGLDWDERALAAARRDFGANATVHALDVADEDAVARVIGEVAGQGALVGLVNSAGIAANVLLADTDVALFRRILDVNVIGSFLVARTAIPHMTRAGGGAIVNIASVSGMQGNMGRTAYGASKGAVITMTKIMAVELAEASIRVNAISPGPVETAMVREHHSQAERDNWLIHLPMKRYGTPEEIAAGIAFLIDGSQSGYVTGQILAIDGGFVSGGTVRP